MPSNATAAISAIIPAWKRIEPLLSTLDQIAACEPRPAQILVHIDHGEEKTRDAVRAAHPDVDVLFSTAHVGPGGGRNALIQAASQPLLASFDDDSYPLQQDYFTRAVDLAAQYPAAAAFAAHISEHDNEPAPTQQCSHLAGFTGCGCILRRDAIRNLPGFLPLPIAYAAEEVDLSLQILDAGHEILHAPALHVRHNPDSRRHDSPDLVAGAMRNQFLLTLCRYPRRLWPFGLLQCLRRFIFYVHLGRTAAALKGLRDVPAAWRELRPHRKPVSARAIFLQHRLRRNRRRRQPSISP